MMNAITIALAASLFLIVTVAVSVRGQVVPVVTAVSGCGTQQGAAVIDCYPSPTLTIYGLNLPTSNAFATVGGVLCTVSNQGYVSPNQLQCSLSDDESPLPFNTLLPVVVTDRATLRNSAPVLLVSFVPFPQPVLHSVSGCGDVGLGTFGCNTSTAMLTVSGSGFVLGNESVQTWSLIYPTTQSFLSQPPLQSAIFLNPSTLIFPFSSFFSQSSVRLSNSGNLTFALGHSYRVTTTSLTIGFVPTTINSGNPPSQPAREIIVNAVSGCVVNEGNTTLGCYRPSLLTIIGSGFPTAGVLIRVGPEQCTTAGVVQSTQLVCEMHDDWINTPSETLLPVVVADMFNAVQSAPFYGVTLATPRVPVISSVSGCVGSGLATYNCVPGVDVLTLTGSAFAIDAKGWSFNAQDLSIRLSADSIQDSGTITIALTASLTATVGSSYGSNLTAYVRHGTFISNFIAVSFAQPTPNITLISSTTCTSISPLAVIGCTAGVSTLYINGLDWYSSPQISVGDIQCRSSLSAGLIFITLPVVVGLIPGVGYDLVATFPDGSSLTLPAAVAFTAAPAISTISSQFCPRDYLGTNFLNCEPGSILTIVGAFFASTVNLSVVLRNFNAAYTLMCDNVQIESPSTLTCQLPVLNTSVIASAGQQITVQMYENATVYSNAVTLVPYRGSTTPAIYNVTGCGGFDPSTRGAVGCYTGAVITISGLLSGFSSQTPRVSIYDTETDVLYECALPTFTTQYTITCMLPFMPHMTEEESVLPIRVTLGKSSNWLRAVGYSSMLSLPSTPASCSCSQVEVGLIICAVLLAVVSVLLVALLWVHLHARPVKQPLSQSLAAEDDEQSRAGRNVELIGGTQ